MRGLVAAAAGAFLLALLAPLGPGAVPAVADASQSPEWVPFTGSRVISATWSAGGYHSYPAIDFAMPVGTPVYASGAGTIAVAVTDDRTCNPVDHGGGSGETGTGVAWCKANGYADSGTRIRIAHPDGRSSVYLHLSVISAGIEVGTRVAAGEQLGLSGSTGISTGPHLHYQENDASGTPVDPGPLVACQGSHVVNYADPQALDGATVTNSGYGCHPNAASVPIWSPGGGVPSLGATVGMYKDGRLQAFAVGIDRRVHTRVQRHPNGPWGPWTTWPAVGGLTLRLPVTVAAYRDGRLQVFVASVDGQIRTRLQSRPNGDWGGWVIWSGYSRFPSQTPIAVASHRDGRLQLFAVGSDRRVHTRVQRRTNGPWGPWAAWSGYHGFAAATPLSVVANRDGRLQLLGVGTDGRVHGRLQGRANGGFGSWRVLSGYSHFPLRTPVSAARMKGGRLEAFAVGAGGRVYTTYQRRPGGSWSRWSAWAGYAAFPTRSLVTPALNRDGRMQVFVVGAGGRAHTKYQQTANGAWADWFAWGDYHSFGVRTPIVVRMCPDGRLLAIAVGGGGRMFSRYQEAPNRSWGEWFAWGAYGGFQPGAGS